MVKKKATSAASAQTAIGAHKTVAASAAARPRPTNVDIDEAGFLSGALECSIFWRSIKKTIVLNSPERESCLHWGQVILKAWKNAPKVDKESKGVRRRESIESEITQDLFYCSVLSKKPYSQRFTWVTDAFLDESGKKVQAMLFRSTLPVLWRNLEVPNEEVRMAVSSIILKFFPLLSDDEFIREEYLSKQQEAMLVMLMDDCVPIRTMAARMVPKHLAAHWDMFPRELMKAYLEKLVDYLSYDSLPDVRAAVFKGMEYLLPSASALTATQRSLELLVPRGVNDKTEKVRLAALKMLNKLHGHRYIKLLDVVKMENLLLRLDFEQSDQVQKQIVQLVFRVFCPIKVEGIDYMERFKRIYFMCKVSRTASFHFHRLIPSLELMDVQAAVRHIRCLLVVVKMMLRKIGGSENMMEDETGEPNALMTSCLADKSALSATSFMSEQANTGDPDKLRTYKDVLDSAIILWMSIRSQLYEQCNAVENAEVTKMMASFLQTLEQFSKKAELMDSALVIASNLPKDRIGRLFGQVKNILELEEINPVLFPHYIEALASWDMNKLIELLSNGLKRLRNAIVSATDPYNKMVTPRRTPRRRLDSSLSVDSSCSSFASPSSVATTAEEDKNKGDLCSPPTKRSKKMKDKQQMELRRPPAGPDADADEQSADLRAAEAFFTVHMDGFQQKLGTIRKQFGTMLCTPGNEQSFDLRTLVTAYETYNILALITKKIEEGKSTNVVSEEEGNLPVNDRLLYEEMKWFAAVLQHRTPTFPIIEMFLRCAGLHLSCSKLTVMVLNEMANMLIEIRNRVMSAFDADRVEVALKKCAIELREALENCDESPHDVKRTLDGKVLPLIQSLGRRPLRTRRRRIH